MSNWKHIASEHLPSFNAIIQKSKGPIELWAKLSSELLKLIAEKNIIKGKEILKYGLYVKSNYGNSQQQSVNYEAFQSKILENISQTNNSGNFMSKCLTKEEFRNISSTINLYTSKKNWTSVIKSYEKK